MRRIAVTRLAAGFGNRLFQIAAALEVVGSDLDRVRVHGKTGEKAVRMEAERMQRLKHVLQRRLGQASRSAQRLNTRLGKYGYVALAEDGRRTSREPRDPLERSVYGRITRFGMSY